MIGLLPEGAQLSQIMPTYARKRSRWKPFCGACRVGRVFLFAKFPLRQAGAGLAALDGLSQAGKADAART